MKLFGKKKETKSCCCGEIARQKQCKIQKNKKQEQGIKILGSGCVKCNGIRKSNQSGSI